MATGGPTVAKAYVAIIPTTQGAQKAIADEMIPAAAAAGEGGGEALNEAMSSTITKGAGKIAAAVAAIGIGKAFIDLTKGAVDAYSAMEQLTGGVETIFGEETGRRVEEMASTAFKRVQMSANDYMSTVTGFSASLIQSLGGDTEAAADMADIAIVDMADNANKMGTSLGSLQDAYRGFSRGIFTMLDNLALGYGGNQAEMLRLVHDAGVVDEAVTDIADVSFADMIQGIHVIQDRMGIAGASAQEAATTLEGSANTMKASWEDWLATIGTGDMSAITRTTQNLGDSVMAWLKNLLPRVATIIASIFTLIPQAIGDIVRDLPRIAGELWTGITDALANVTIEPGAIAGPLSALFDSSIGQAIAGLAGRIGEAFGRVFGDIDVAAAFDDIRSAAEGALGVVGDLINGATDAVAGFIDSIDTDAIAGFFQWMRDIAEAIFPRIQSALEVVGRVIAEIVWPLIQKLGGFIADTIWPAIQTIAAAVGPFLLAVVQGIGFIFDGLMAIINGIIDILAPAIDAVWAIVSPIASAIIDFLSWVASGVISVAGGIIGVIGEFVGTLVGLVGGLLSEIGAGVGKLRDFIVGAVEAVKNFIMGLPDFIVGIGEAIWTGLNAIVDWIVDAVTGAIDGLGRFVEDVVDGMGDVVDGVAQGIVGAFQWIRDTAKGIWDAIVGAITGAIQGAWDFISGVIGWIRDGFWGLVDGVAGAFQSIGDAIMAPFSSAFEGIRSLWNSTIGGFGFDIPDWVPVVGGSTFRLPYLATGGELLTAGSVVVGERGPEVLSLPAGARVAPLRDGDAMGDTTYQVMVGDIDLSDDDQVRRVTREYLEYLVGIARPVNVI